MSRLRGLDDHEADSEVQHFLAQDRKWHGETLRTTRIYGRRPTILAGMRALAAGIGKSGLIEPGLQALVCSRVAGVNRCPF